VTEPREASEVEKANLLLDQIRVDLERWRVDNEPRQESYILARELAAQYAKLAMNIMFLLNGGALIAIPTFGEFILRSESGLDTSAFFGISSFVCGLVAISVCVFCSYFGLQKDSSAEWHDIERVRCILNRDVAKQESSRRSYDEKAGTHEECRRGEVVSRERFLRAAMGFWWASLLSFIIGCLFFVSALH